jgi:hypothetical protein
LLFKTREFLQNWCQVAENVRLFSGHNVHVSIVFIHIPASVVEKRILFLGLLSKLTSCLFKGRRIRRKGRGLEASITGMSTALYPKPHTAALSILTPLAFVNYKLRLGGGTV